MSHTCRKIVAAGCLAALAFIVLAMTAGKPSGSGELAQLRAGRATRNEGARQGGLFAPRLTPEERQLRRNWNPATDGATPPGQAMPNMPVPNAGADTSIPPWRPFMSPVERQQRQEALRQRRLNQQADAANPPDAQQPGSGTVRRSVTERTPPQRRPRNPNIPVPSQDAGPPVISRSILDSPAAAPATDEKNIREMTSEEIMTLMEFPVEL